MRGSQIRYLNIDIAACIFHSSETCYTALINTVLVTYF
jgi:hypothetical protein